MLTSLTRTHTHTTPFFSNLDGAQVQPMEEGACQNALEVEEEALAQASEEAPQDEAAQQVNS